MSAHKKVSIVLPTYNGAQYLRESIESCLEQSYASIELIIVDDCSTDHTPRILQKYRRNPRVRVIRHSVNSKLPAALNTGFAHASGSYLSWTSDDNLFAPIAVERMVAHLEKHPAVGFVYTDYWLMDENGYATRRVSAGSPTHLRDRCNIACFLYRRDVRDAVGEYDPKLFRIEDYDYWLRVSQQFQMGWLAEPLYFYRRHPSSLTNEDQIEDRARRFDEIQTRYFGRDPKRRTRVLAQYYIAEAFESHYRRDRPGVLRNAARAIRRRPSLLKNRGVVSIMMQAAIGHSVAEKLKSGLKRASQSPYYNSLGITLMSGMWISADLH